MTSLDLSKARAAAEETARAAGALLRELFNRPRTVSIKGTPIDIVTEADTASEALCREQLQARFPAAFLGEEGGGAEPSPDTLLWVVDPLDGTVNYAHHFPFYVVSIALCVGRVPVVGVVYDPSRDELFSCAQGQGAHCNGVPIRVTDENNLERSLVATGFPYDRHVSADNNLDLHGAFTKTTQGVRRAGAAALDLAYVAAGRLDGYWENKLKPWDLAAGFLLVQEAGGRVTNYQGGPTDPFVGESIAAGPALHAEMLRVIRSVIDARTF
jgi:myo-inositol-1(or 4)-monophosphatase